MSTDITLSNEHKNPTLAYRISYRYQKKKPNDTKRNQNSSLHLDHAPSLISENHNKMRGLRLRKEEIERETDKLKHKIEMMRDAKQINRRANIESADARIWNNHKVQHNKSRYAEEESEMIQLSSRREDRTPKCFIPPVRQKSKQVSRSLEKEKCMSSVEIHFEKFKDSEDEGDKDPELQEQTDQVVSKLEMNRKLSFLIDHNQEHSHEALYCQPEQEPCRIVVCKRTKITAPFHSYVVELSLISKKLLVVAYGMGLATGNFKVMFDKKRTREILKDVNKDYEKLWSMISIDSDGIRIRRRVSDEQKCDYKTALNENEKQMHNNKRPNDKQTKESSKKYVIQQDFLNRNYYEIVTEIKHKKQQEQQRVQRNQLKSTMRFQSRRKQLNKHRGSQLGARQPVSVSQKNLMNELKIGENYRTCRQSVVGIKMKSKKESNSMHRQNFKLNLKAHEKSGTENNKIMRKPAEMPNIKRESGLNKLQINWKNETANNKETFNLSKIRKQSQYSQDYQFDRSNKENNEEIISKNSSDGSDRYIQDQFDQSRQNQSDSHYNHKRNSQKINANSSKSKFQEISDQQQINAADEISDQQQINANSNKSKADEEISKMYSQQEFEGQQISSKLPSQKIEDEEEHSNEKMDEYDWSDAQQVPDKAVKPEDNESVKCEEQNVEEQVFSVNSKT